MKNNRFGNGSLEKAKEADGEGFRRLAVATPGKARVNSATQCATPARRATRRKKTPEQRPAAAGKPATTVKAKVDVGYGNTLTIRGEGQGLSWERGQPMTCIDGSIWVWSGPLGTEPLKFKVLINDQLWCCGADLQLAAGEELEFVPAF